MVIFSASHVIFIVNKTQFSALGLAGISSTRQSGSHGPGYEMERQSRRMIRGKKKQHKGENIARLG